MASPWTAGAGLLPTSSGPAGRCGSWTQRANGRPVASLRRVFTDLASPCAVKSIPPVDSPQSGSGEVTRIDITTGFRETIAHVVRGIDNIALAPDDRLFISHFADGRVGEWSSGAERLLSDSELLGPCGIAILPDGSVVFADGLSVGRLGADGTIERTHTLLSDLPTLAVGIGILGGEPVVAGARGQVIRCRAGERGVPIGGRITDPAAITSDGAESVLIVERSAGRVTRLNPDGTTEPVMAGLHRPAAAAIDDAGLLWVACTDALVAIMDAQVVQRIPELAGAFGCAVGPTGCSWRIRQRARFASFGPVDRSRRWSTMHRLPRRSSGRSYPMPARRSPLTLVVSSSDASATVRSAGSLPADRLRSGLLCRTMSARYWVMLPPSRSAATTVAVATTAEDRGLEGVFSIQLGSSPWPGLGAVAATTSRLRIATGIALGLSCPEPYMHAEGGHFLQEWGDDIAREALKRWK